MLTPKPLAISFAALFAFSTLALVAPPAAAQPCTEAGSCCGLTLCQCTLCGLPPLVIGDCHAISEGDAYAGATASTCPASGAVYVCTSPVILMPVDPKSPPKLDGCAATTSVVLPAQGLNPDYAPLFPTTHRKTP